MQKKLERLVSIGTQAVHIGVCAQPKGEKCPYMAANAKWLEDHGVPAERILIEDRSTNTHENLAFARELIEADAGKPVWELRVKIVTSDFQNFCQNRPVDEMFISRAFVFIVKMGLTGYNRAIKKNKRQHPYKRCGAAQQKRSCKVYVLFCWNL